MKSWESDMRRYDSYKDSDVAWIGEIPEHWDTIKMKYLFSERSEKGFPDEPILCSTQKYGVIPQSMYENRVVVVNKGLEGLKLVEHGDFVISLRSFQGGIEYAHYRGIISAAYTILKLVMADKLNENYVRFLFKSIPFVGLLQTCVTGIREGQNINYSILRKSEIPVPPLDEQQNIVEFLDEKTAKIDTYIQEKEKEICSLEELKQSEIAFAVTHGIKHDVSMKDNGIAWIGEIPEHWDTIKMKYLFSERSEKGFPDEPILCSTQKYGVIPQSMYENRVVVVNKGLEGLKLVEHGDFVISLRSFQGGIEYAHYRGIISAAYTILKLVMADKLNEDYVRFLFKSIPFIGLLQICVTGIREGQNINYSILRKSEIPVPPLDEQQQIVEYIQQKTVQIDTYISDVKRLIDSLKEYRHRLICDAVTGRINVQPKF
jgi:type I restriction enzyme S subunit